MSDIILAKYSTSTIRSWGHDLAKLPLLTVFMRLAGGAPVLSGVVISDDTSSGLFLNVVSLLMVLFGTTHKKASENAASNK